MKNRFQQSGAAATSGKQEATVAEPALPSAELQSTIEAFVRFDAWIDERLTALESRWVHVAAPAATRPRRIAGSTSHPAKPAES
jgi:hypothetical protein